MKLFDRKIERGSNCAALPQFERNVRLIGMDSQNKLCNSRVLVIGVGGVGGFALELLTRAGVGRIGIVDGDKVDITNLNRQILATHSSIGENKVDVAEQRIAIINPRAEVSKFCGRYSAITSEEILGSDADCGAEVRANYCSDRGKEVREKGDCAHDREKEAREKSDCAHDRAWDYCIDAIDSVSDKIHLIMACQRKKIPIISAMGAGNRLEFDYRICDIFQTKYDGLARTLRKRLRESGISQHTVACSSIDSVVQNCDRVVGSFAPSPSMLGNVIASYVLGELINDRNSKAD